MFDCPMGRVIPQARSWGTGPMNRWSQEARPLPPGAAADPEAGPWRRLPARPEHAGGDPDRPARQQVTHARPARPARQSSSSGDPDDVKPAPEPAIKLHPVPATPPPPASLNAPPQAPARQPQPPAEAPAGPPPSRQAEPRATTPRSSPSKPPGPRPSATAPAAAGPAVAGTAADQPPSGRSASSKTPPQGTAPSPPAAKKTPQSPPPAFDPDDAKTAPQPAIRVHPAAPPGLPLDQPPASAVGYDQHGFAPQTSRPGRDRRPARSQPQPSWVTIVANTVRLWRERRTGPGERRTRPDSQAGQSAGNRRRIQAAALVLVVLAAAAVGFALTSGNNPKSPRRPAPANPVLTAQAARGAAGAWVSQQAGRNTLVSCDPVMCGVLVQHGFPAANLVTLGPNAPDPLASDLVVATSALRSQFGSRLSSVYAPLTLATFGAGSSRVDIRAVAPDGAAAYTGELRSDLASRKTVGAQLLHNSKIQVAAAARGQLASGAVDARLLVTLATMADIVHPLEIVSFGGPAAGASPGVPLRTAVVAGTPGGTASHAAVLASLRSFLAGQQPPYLPSGTQIVPAAPGQSALRIQFAAPSPLGLLSAGLPVVKIPQR